MKLLVALSRYPWPLEKGDKLRAYYQLKGLAQKHEVHLVCLNDVPVSEEDLKQLSFCKTVTVVQQPRWKSMLKLLGGFFDSRPFQVHFFHSRPMRKAMESLLRAHQIDVAYVQLIRLGMNLPGKGGIGWYLDFMDTFSIGMQQRSHSGNPLMRLAAKIESRRLKKYEDSLARRFDGWSVISERDLDALPANIRGKVAIIPNGVGEAFFEEMPGQAKQYDLVFFGNMGYHPNVESARYLMEEIVPVLKQRGLELKICFAGARPAPAIQSYASDTVTVTGFVDDIRIPVKQARIAIAPVIAGQGMQNKLIESMAMGLPTLTTPLAHAALPAEAGVEIIVCATPEEFAVQIERLLKEPEYAEAIAMAGRAFVERNYRWKEMNNRLEKGLLNVASMKRTAH